MANRNDFVALLKKMLVEGTEDEKTIRSIEVMPLQVVKIKKSELTDENRKAFIEVVSKIKNIHKGVSHLHLMNMQDFQVEPHIVTIVIAIGKAFGLWTLIPMDFDEPARSQHLKDDKDGALPMITGMDQRGDWDNK